jgi:hypothetical protein
VQDQTIAFGVKLLAVILAIALQAFSTNRYVKKKLQFSLFLAALSLSWAASRSLTLLMAVALGGFVVRMGLVTLILLLVKDESWIDLTALGVTVLVTHLGLLFWELRYVSASLAFPALKPGHKEAVQP